MVLFVVGLILPIVGIFLMILGISILIAVETPIVGKKLNIWIDCLEKKTGWKVGDAVAWIVSWLKIFGLNNPKRR